MADWPIDAFRPPLGAGPTALLVAAVALAALALYGRRWWRRGQHGVAEDDGDDLPPWRRGLLLGLRLGAVALLAWVLAGPSAYRAAAPAARRVPVVLLADTSASMAEPDVVAEDAAPTGAPRTVSRWQALGAHWLTPALLDPLQRDAEVRLVGFDTSIRPLSLPEARALTPAGRGTHLFAAIEQVTGAAAAGQPQSSPGGILVLLSDGHDTQRASDPALAQKLADAGWRVLAVPVGARQSVRDLALLADAEADFLFDGQSTVINATITRTGLDVPEAKVNLLEDGRLLETQTARFGDQLAAKVRFRVRPTADPGQAVTVRGYQVVVEPAPGERFLDNNTRWVFVQVQRERIKVALIEGEPYWDTRFLAQVLRDDAQVNLTSVFGLSPRRSIVTYHAGASEARRPSAPAAEADAGGFRGRDGDLFATQAAVNDYDAIILGKGVQRYFGGERARMLVDFVRERGGALVLARGGAFDLSEPAGQRAQEILAAIEPVTWGRQTLRDMGLSVTEAGRASPLLEFPQLGAADAVLTRLPDMLAATQVRQEKAASIVLLRQTPRGSAGPAPMAAMAYQNVGRGRTLAVLTDGLWQWAFLPSSLREYDSVYQMFWARTIRWLVTGGEFLPGQSVALTLSKLTTEPEQPVTVTVSTRYVEPRGFAPKLRITAPSGNVAEVALTPVAEQSPRYLATLRPVEPGVHSIELSAPGMTPPQLTSRLAVYDQSVEKLDPSARPETLAELARATRGECLGLDESARLVEEVQRLGAARVADRKLEYVFDHPAVLALVVALLGAEWIARRRWGLL